jgi:squalene monooxygenase
MNTENNEYDVCIIGAGLAGGVLAAYLGTNGKRVAVIEKLLIEQDGITGELLQPGGVEKLTEMKLEHLLEGIDAQKVDGYGLFLNKERIQLHYPQNTEKVFQGRGFRYGKFISSIRNYIRSLDNVTFIEGTVTDFIEDNEHIYGLKYTDKKTGTENFIHAPLTVACDGAFSLFRQKLSNATNVINSYFLGLVLKNVNLPYPNHGHVILAEPSPVLAYPISNNECRMLIDFPGQEIPKKSPELIAYLKEKIAPQLPEEILPAYFDAIEEGKFKVMPSQLVPAQATLKKGAVLLGDSLNMRHPLTGGGMTVALTDIYCIGQKLLGIDLNNAKQLHNTIQEYYELHHTNNATVNILADALYGVVKDPQLKIACFEYLKKGEDYYKEPISLLSAVNRERTTLLKHFLSVAFFGVNDNIKFPTPNNVGKAYTMIKNALEILNPLMLNENPDMVTKGALKVTESALKVTNSVTKTATNFTGRVTENAQKFKDGALKITSRVLE